MAVFIDVLNHMLDDYHKGHRQEHTGCLQKLPAQNNAQNNGYRMQVQGFAHNGGINKVVVNLRHNQVENGGLDSQSRSADGRHEDAEAGGYRRPQHGNKLAKGGGNGKNGSIGQARDGKIAVDDGACYEADDKLAADIGAQREKNPIQQVYDALSVTAWKQVRHIDFYFIPVHQKVEGQEKNNHEIYQLIEQGKGNRQRGCDGFCAEGGKLRPHLVHALLEEPRFRQAVQLLDIGGKGWQLLGKTGEGRYKVAGYQRNQAQKEYQKACQHQKGSQPPGHPAAELVHRIEEQQRQQYGQEKNEGKRLHVPEGRQQRQNGRAYNNRGFVGVPHGHHLQLKKLIKKVTFAGC